MSYVYKLRQASFVMLAAVCLLLAACGGSTSPTSAPGAQPTTATGQATSAPPAQATTAATTEATTAPSGQATQPASGSAGACPAGAANQSITMWSPLTGPDGNTMTDMAAKFTAENGMGIKVTHLPQPDYMQKLNASAAAKNLPEMTIARAINVGELAARNVLQPLTPDMMSVIGDVQSDFPPQFWQAGDYKGKHYTIPLDAQALVLYYNKDMFKAAGLPEPSPDTPMSKADFEKAADTLNKNGVAGVAIGTGFQGATLFQALIRQFGGAVSDEKGTKATYNSDAGVKALQYVADLKKKYSPAISGAGDPEVKVFQQGKAAMVIHGPWHISDMEKLGFVGYAPFPQIGDQYAVWGGGHQFGVTTTDPAKQLAAACWIAWASKNSAQWALAGNVPIRESVRTSGQLTTIAPPVAAYAASAPKVILLTASPGLEGALWDQFGPAVDAVLLGQTTDIQKALNDAAAKSDKVLADNAAKYQ